ncbi:MAG: hypothetical protein IT319_09730, partial [Anaerolineae bacterium]|nr:hypothetical protein [Anaerolineae bacterium]
MSQAHDTQPLEPVIQTLSRVDDEPEDDYTQEIVARRGGIGCWVTGLVTLVVFVGLVGIGLFLPPINLYQRLTAPRMTTLTAGANTVSDSGLTLASYDLNNGETLGVSISSLPMNRFLAGDASAGAWIPDALAAVPPSLALQSAVYSVTATDDDTPVTLSVELPAGADAAIFDLYGWDGNKWRFLPAQADQGKLAAAVDTVPEQVALFQATPLDQPRVLASYDVTQVLAPDVARLATIVSPAGLQPTLDGKLVGNLAAGFDMNAGYLLVPAIRNYADPRATDPDTVAAILSNNDLRREHAAQVAAFAGSGYDGVLIDYRDLPADQRQNFSAFIADLGKQLDQAGLLLVVAVPMPQAVDGLWDTGAYDWRALGAAATYLQLDLDSNPRQFVAAGDGSPSAVESLLRWAVGEVSRDKLLLGLSALSQREASGSVTAIGYDQALSALGDVQVNAERTESGTINPGFEVQAQLDGFHAVTGVEANSQTYLDYQDENGSTVARMWLTTPDALRYRMDRTLLFALGGVAFDDLMSGGLA